MTEEYKTTLFYMLALAGLFIGSILFTGRIEPLTEEQAALATPTVAKANSTFTLRETEWKVCTVTTQKRAFYVADTNQLVDQRLVISGTIYASDFITPLPDVLIEIRPERQSGSFGSFSEPPDYLFQAWARTDASGHFEAAVLRPSHGTILPFYYRIRYQNGCPLGLQLFLVDEETGLTNSALPSTLAKLGLAQGEPASPLLRGPVDMALPVAPPPPLPEASRAVGVASPSKSVTKVEGF